MPEPEPTGHIGAADEIDAQKFIDRIGGAHLGDCGRGAGEFGLERVARDRRTLDNKSSTARQLIEFFCQRRRHYRRHVDIRHCRRHRFRRVFEIGCRGELLEVERIPARLSVEEANSGWVHRSAEELLAFLDAERGDVDAGERRPTVDRSNCRPQPRRRLPRSRCDRTPR